MLLASGARHWGDNHECHKVFDLCVVILQALEL
jgi:hypothetical protein